MNFHDIIVSHPNSISPNYQGLEPIPIDLIDAVFMDEAHHEPAPTWQSLNSFYRTQFKVFFTTTPFRRDRKRIRAKLIYHNSLEHPLEKEILRPIEFHGESIGDQPPDSNKVLLETAIAVFEEERKANPK